MPNKQRNGVDAPAVHAEPKGTHAPEYRVKSQITGHVALFLLAAAGCVAAFFLWDIPLAEYFWAHRGSWLYVLFRSLAKSGESHPYLIAGAIAWAACRAWRSERAAHAGYFFVTVAATGLMALLVKMALARYRPDMFFDEELYGFLLMHHKTQYLSFPSGHATTYLAVCGALGRLYPRCFWPLCVMGFMLSFGRVVTTHHYLSDVIAGAWLGYAGSALFWPWFFARHKERLDSVQE